MSHALFIVYEHPRDTWTEQKGFLHERIIPMVKAQPGFAAGFWTYDASASRTHGCIVFESEAAARSFEAFMREERARPNPLGVKQVSLLVTEVVGEARAG